MDYYGRDVQFVLDQITLLNERDKLLAHRLDLTRIAALGHCSGFNRASNACRRDSRIKACQYRCSWIYPGPAVGIHQLDSIGACRADTTRVSRTHTFSGLPTAPLACESRQH